MPHVDCRYHPECGCTPEQACAPAEAEEAECPYCDDRGCPRCDDTGRCVEAEADAERDAQLALLRQRNAELLAENAKLHRLVATQRIVIEARTTKERT